MALPYELRFLGHTKGQVLTALACIISFGLFVGTILLTLPAEAAPLSKYDAVWLSVASGLEDAPTSKSYHRDDDSYAISTYDIKKPTAVLIYYSEVPRHLELYKLLKKARFTAAVEKVALNVFDCSRPEAACDNYYDKQKLEKSDKDALLSYYQDGENDDHPFKPQSGAILLSSVERWIKDGARGHKKRKADREKKLQEDVRNYRGGGGGMGGMGVDSGMDPEDPLGGMGGIYGYGDDFVEKMEL